MHLADVDQMQFSGNAYANELAGNGLMTFFAAFQRNELYYERFYTTLPAEQADRILDPRLRDEAVAYYQTAFKAFK